MPNKSLKCETCLKVNVISCPGVWLQCRNDIFLKIFMFGKYEYTRLIIAIFPLLIFEKFHFQKSFPDCSDPADLASALENEQVFLELVQVSHYRRKGTILATYESTARDFLFPLPIIRPTYTESERELLFTSSAQFSGIIAPKLEFSTTTMIKEYKDPAELRRKYHYLEYKSGSDKNIPSLCYRFNESPEYDTWEVDHPCTICNLYKKYFKRDYVGHHHPPFSTNLESYNSSPTLAKTRDEIKSTDDSLSSDDASCSSQREMKRLTSRSNESHPRRISVSDMNSLESKSMIDLSNIPSSSRFHRRIHSRRHIRQKLNEELEKLYSNLYDEIKWREENCD